MRNGKLGSRVRYCSPFSALILHIYMLIELYSMDWNAKRVEEKKIEEEREERERKPARGCIMRRARI